MSYEICILQEVNHLMLFIIVFGHSSIVFGVLRPRKGSREWYKAMNDLREGPRAHSLRVYGLKCHPLGVYGRKPPRLSRKLL